MKVKLLTHTPDPDKIVSAAARLCYSPDSAIEIMDKMSALDVEDLVKRLVEMGHMSPLEHISFTFAIDGVSRALSHQMVRHRIGVSYSQKSQRYVNESGSNSGFVIPHTIEGNEAAKKTYLDALDKIMVAYDELCQVVPAEDARYILPNATETNFVVTYNARSLIHFFELRLCSRAQWEIREMSKLMLAEVREISPLIFRNVGPTCDTMGICFEGKLSCNKVKDIRSRL